MRMTIESEDGHLSITETKVAVIFYEDGGSIMMKQVIEGVDSFGVCKDMIKAISTSKDKVAEVFSEAVYNDLKGGDDEPL